MEAHYSPTLVLKKLLFGLLCLSTALNGTPAYALDPNALPNGGVVVNGSAQFDYTIPNELHIQQSTDKAVINWNSFNIGENATTQFHQNSSNSIAVNRVIGAGLDPTQIMGTLKANGRIIVLDRNGVIFGQNSQVNVGGIIASTGNIDDTAFMNNGQLAITGADTGGQIVNNGSITAAQAGLVAFVGPTVKNNGVINAKLGQVTLASGNAATVDLYGDGLVELAVDQPIQNALIENTGSIFAEGGIVRMTAAAAKDIVNTVINTSGIVDVSSATVDGGKIILEGANTEVSGTLNASGKTGGGTILIGGDYQGKGTTKTANKTTITKTAKIKANATGETGNGGKVIVWADDSTRFDGTIEAKGGYVSGDGGFVETSGKINLGVTGDVDASAVNGLAGSWLLDPSNVIIVGSGGNNIGGGTTNPSSDSFQVNASSIQTALNAGNNVTITTTNGSGTQAGNITTNGTVNINKTAGGNVTLTLQAANNIELNDTTISSTNNRLGVSLVADSDSNGSGAITLGNVNLTTKNGDINFNKAVTLTDNNVWNAGTGVLTTGSTVDMGTHNLDITAGNANIGGNIHGIGSSVLTLKPSSATADLNINDGYNFVLDLTEASYLNPGSKLVLGYAGLSTGETNIVGWDMTGKNFDLEVHSGHFGVDQFKQGNGSVKIYTGVAYLYNILLGSKDFYVEGRKIGGTAGYINMQENIVKNAAGESTLTLKSAGDINAKDIISTDGALNVVLWNDFDNTQNDGGFNHFMGTLTTRGGNIYVVGGLDDGANGGVAGDGIGDNYSGPGSILWGVNYDAGGGDILVQGHGRSSTDIGFNIGSASTIKTSGDGNITIRGIAGNANGNRGIDIGGATQISAEDGTIRIEGTNDRARTGGESLFIGGDSKIFTTGTTGGDIYLTGTRTNATSLSYAIELYGTEIKTQNGNIYLTGTNTVTNNGVNAVAVHSWGNQTIASQTGDIFISGTSSATTGTATDWVTDGGGTYKLGDSTSTGDITLNVNTFTNYNTLEVKTLGKGIIKPRTASTSIGVSGGAGTMNLSDAVLNNFSVGTLVIGDSVNGTGDINVDTWDLSSKGYNVELYGNDINLNGLTLGTKDFSAYAKDNGVDVGDLSVLASITKSVAGRSALDLQADNNVTFTPGVSLTASTGSLDMSVESDKNHASAAGGNIAVTNSTFTSNGGDINLTAGGASNITLNNSSLLPSSTGKVNLNAGGDLSYVSPLAIVVDNVSGRSVFLRASVLGHDITTRGKITATGTGDAAVLATKSNFINEYGADLFDMSGGGRWLIYSTNPSLNTRNGLMPNAEAIYGTSYFTGSPAGIAAGNRFLFSDAASNAPTVVIKADDATKAAGTPNGSLGFTVDSSGLIAGDSAEDVYAGTPAISTTVDNSTPEGVYANAVNIAAGSLVSYLGYNFTFQSGNFTVTAAPPPVTPPVTTNPIQNFDTVVANMSSTLSKAPLMSVSSIGGVNLQSFSPFLLSVQYAPLPATTDVAVDGDTLYIK